MAAGSDNLFPKLITVVQASDAAAPANGDWKIYAKAGGIYARSSNSVVGPFGAAAASGGLVLLNTQTASASASLDFTTVISSTYDEYVFEGVAVRPATNGTNLTMLMGTGGGPTYDTAGNYYGTNRTGVGASGAPASGGSSNGATTQADAPGTSIMVGEVVANDAAYGQTSFSLRLTIPQSATQHKHIYGNAVWHNGTEVFMVMVGYLYASVTAVTAVRFIMAAGNITSGVIRAYGIAK